VLENIKRIVREEMNALGAEEIIMTALQRKELWEVTDRWSDEKVDVWFKSALKNGTEIGFGWSHEEQISDMMKNYVSSYRDLPVFTYQFQTKLRNELRAKSGIMRGREFVMKDMYSYTVDAEAHKRFYDATKEAYLKVFGRVGLGDRTFVTFASGGAFTEFSHEFQTLTESGEDTIYLAREKGIAINKEVLRDDVLEKLGLKREELEEVPAAEVGNIFDFGGIKSEQLGLLYKNEAGENVPVHLGSYGIGITRLMGVVVEALSDEKGIVWPASIAPFRAHLILASSNEMIRTLADEVYQTLEAAGVEVLYDDRDVRAGEKFADSDLIGIPTRVIVGDKTAGGLLEIKDRQSGAVEHMTLDHLITHLTA
jgi:prolyl-tRNA synthetase